MAKFNKIEVGQVLYDVQKAKERFFKSQSKWDIWLVAVVSINTEERTAMCSWNSNKPTLYFERSIEKLRVKKPMN